MPFWPPKRHVSGCKTACFATRNGTFCDGRRQALFLIRAMGANAFGLTRHWPVKKQKVLRHILFRINFLSLHCPSGFRSTGGQASRDGTTSHTICFVEKRTPFCTAKERGAAAAASPGACRWQLSRCCCCPASARCAWHRAAGSLCAGVWWTRCRASLFLSLWSLYMATLARGHQPTASGGLPSMV